jgi:hypothetical protein
MQDEHIENIERALSYMRNARRAAVKELATGSKSNEHQRGTTDDNMDRLVRYQRVINSLLEAQADEGRCQPPSDVAVQIDRSFKIQRHAEDSNELGRGIS